MVYKARIKFDNREWLVIDNIQYEGEKYYYIIEDISKEIEEIDSIENYKGKITAEFIYKLDNGNYKNVVDKNLIDNLLFEVGQKAILSKEDFK